MKNNSANPSFSAHISLFNSILTRHLSASQKNASLSGAMDRKQIREKDESKYPSDIHLNNTTVFASGLVERPFRRHAADQKYRCSIHFRAFTKASIQGVTSSVLRPAG